MIKKILTMFLIIFLLIVLINNKVFAVDLSEVITDGDSFLSAGSSEEAINEAALQSTSNSVYNVLLVIAIVLAFAIGMIIGIQFITGSVEEQAKVKETLIPYVVGVFIVFSAFTIWKIAINLGNEVAPTGQVDEDPTTGEAMETTYHINNGNTNMIYCDHCHEIIKDAAGNYIKEQDVQPWITKCQCGYTITGEQ